MIRLHRAAPVLPLLASLWTLGPAAPAGGTVELAFERLPLSGLLRASAVAAAPAGAGIAVGDADGVLQLVPGAAPQRVFRRGPVHALLFGADGALLVGGAHGLYRVAPEGSSQRLELGPGAAARSVRRLLGAGGLVFAASDEGVHVSRDGRSFTRLDAGLPSGAVHALALRAEATAGATLYVGFARRVFALPLDAEGTAAGPVRELALPPRAAREGVMDLATGRQDGELAVLTPRRLIVFAADEAREVPLPLPPGAGARRLALGAGWVVIAAERGALVGDGGWSFRRAAAPLASARLADLARDGGSLYAAGVDGVWRAGLPEPPAGARPARAESGARSAVRPMPAPVASDPSAAESAVDAAAPLVAALRRAALHHLGLGMARIDALRAGVARRGWLPELELRAALARDRRRSFDHDEVVSSGELRALHDRARHDDRDLELSVRLAWDLGEVRYHPEALDVSREAREVIELRDDVLDEINRLYFERLRVLEARAALPEGARSERAALALRAAELAAGLDAWTDGAFARATASPRTPGLEDLP